MFFLIARAYTTLIFFEPYLRRRRFSAFSEDLNRVPLGRQRHSLERISRAVDIACICYWKQVFCLQRSAATTLLLRRYGFPAQTIVGVRQMPFKSHAWVEVCGRVANDKPYMRQIYQVLTNTHREEPA